MEPWSRSGVAFLIVAVLASGCYLNALGGSFISDDQRNIVDNTLLRAPHRLPDVFTSPMRGNKGGSYRPITALTYWIDLRLYGPNPFGFHLENLLWHTATALLVLVLLRGLWPAEPLLAFGAAALFAVHPVHTEAVSWISGRSEILAAFWGLLAFLAHRRADSVAARASLWRIAALAAWLVAMGAKEMAATLPLLLLMTDALLGRPSEWWRPVRLVTRYGPYAVAGVAYVALRWSILGRFAGLGLNQAFLGEPLSVRGATMLKVGAAYVGRLLFPVNLNADWWAVPHARGLTDGPLPLLALALLIGLLGLAWAVRRTAPPVAWGILWSGLALLPVSNLIPIGELGAERFLYTSSVGACVAIAWVMTRGMRPHKEASSRAPIPLAGALGCAVLVLFAVNIIDRNRDWSDGLLLWEKTVRQSPQSPRANRNLSIVLKNKGRYAEAKTFLNRALDIKAKTFFNLSLEILEKDMSQDIPLVAQSLNNLAAVYQVQGQYAKAEALHKRALALREKFLGPDHPLVAQSLNNLGASYHSQSQYAKAEALLKRALAIREKALGPDHPLVAQSLNSLALVHHSQGQYAKAEPLYKRALAIHEKALGPDHPRVAQSLNNLAAVYQVQGQYAKAEALLKRALAIRKKTLGPDHPDVAISLNNLALVHHSQGQYAKAEPLYKRALAIHEKALGPNHPRMTQGLNNLAELYMKMGRDEEAKKLLDRAKRIRANQ